VKLSLRIGSDGRLLDAQTDGVDPNSALAKAALAMAREARFEPALKDGVPVESHMSLSLSIGRPGAAPGP
jgi:TonB family protein